MIDILCGENKKRRTDFRPAPRSNEMINSDVPVPPWISFEWGKKTYRHETRDISVQPMRLLEIYSLYLDRTCWEKNIAINGLFVGLRNERKDRANHRDTETLLSRFVFGGSQQVIWGWGREGGSVPYLCFRALDSMCVRFPQKRVAADTASRPPGKRLWSEIICVVIVGIHLTPSKHPCSPHPHHISMWWSTLWGWLPRQEEEYALLDDESILNVCKAHAILLVRWNYWSFRASMVSELTRCLAQPNTRIWLESRICVVTRWVCVCVCAMIGQWT